MVDVEEETMVEGGMEMTLMETVVVISVSVEKMDMGKNISLTLSTRQQQRQSSVYYHGMARAWMRGNL